MGPKSGENPGINGLWPRFCTSVAAEYSHAIEEMCFDLRQIVSKYEPSETHRLKCCLYRCRRREQEYMQESFSLHPTKDCLEIEVAR